GLLVGAAIAGLTVILDQASKFYVLTKLRLQETLDAVALTPFLELKFTWNRGISYGLFQQGDGFGRWLLVALSGVALVVIGFWLARARSAWTVIALGLIAGGAFGNALDRARLGAVADFLHLHGGSIGWLDFPYIFNVADAGITVGVVILLV